MDENITRIVHSEEILEAYLPLLEKMYVEDYGRKYQQLIKERLQNTICITTSTPDYDYQFIKKYHQEKNIPNIDAVVSDFENYKKLKENIALKRNIAIYNLICKYMEIDASKYLEHFNEIINLSFMGYSSKTKNSKNVKVIEIPNLEKMQEEYLAKCDELGIKPLTDSKKIDTLGGKIGTICRNFQHELLTKSSFVNNLKYSIYQITGTAYTQSDLSTLIEYPAACSMIYNKKNNNISSIVYLPLTQIYQEGYNLDSFLLHEFRHAVELSFKGIGLNLQGNYSGYRIINELRTELHAKEDLERIETIFSRSNKYSGYFPYLPIIEKLVSNFQNVFDELAFNNNVKMLESLFSKDELTKLEEQLIEMFYTVKSYSIINSSISTKVDISDIDKQIMKIHDISVEKGVKRYRKILKKENHYE